MLGAAERMEGEPAKCGLTKLAANLKPQAQEPPGYCYPPVKTLYSSINLEHDIRIHRLTCARQFHFLRIQPFYPVLFVNTHASLIVAAHLEWHVITLRNITFVP